MSNGQFNDLSNHMWIGVMQETEKKDKQVMVNIGFQLDGNTFDGITVFETPIVTIVDDEHSKKII